MSALLFRCSTISHNLSRMNKYEDETSYQNTVEEGYNELLGMCQNIC